MQRKAPSSGGVHLLPVRGRVPLPPKNAGVSMVSESAHRVHCTLKHGDGDGPVTVRRPVSGNGERTSARHQRRPHRHHNELHPPPHGPHRLRSAGHDILTQATGGGLHPGLSTSNKNGHRGLKRTYHAPSRVSESKKTGRVGVNENKRSLLSNGTVMNTLY